jgi:hypothetical protein
MEIAEHKTSNLEELSKEYKLIDDTRVDCLTKTHAIEFDFASKWAEAVGQSLHYSNLTSKTAGIVLIIEKPSDYKHYNKIEKLSKKYNIALWQMKAQDYNNYTQEVDIIEIIINLIQKIIKILLSLF